MKNTTLDSWVEKVVLLYHKTPKGSVAIVIAGLLAYETIPHYFRHTDDLVFLDAERRLDSHYSNKWQRKDGSTIIIYNMVSPFENKWNGDMQHIQDQLVFGASYRVDFFGLNSSWLEKTAFPPLDTANIERIR